jgi:hypothetical protein
VGREGDEVVEVAVEGRKAKIGTASAKFGATSGGPAHSDGLCFQICKIGAMRLLEKMGDFCGRELHESGEGGKIGGLSGAEVWKRR